MLLPVPDLESQFFWDSGRDGILRLLRCGSCGYWIHPPTPVCPECFSREVAPQPLSGRGIIHSFTINHQQWAPGQDVPYVIVLVELDEQPGLRLTSSLLGAGSGEVAIGTAVQVTFSEHDGLFIPLFHRIARPLA